MVKRVRRIAAVLLASTLLLQSGIQGMAAEGQTENMTEAVATEAPQTQAPTEAPQTQAPTEAPQTQAPTEAPQTQAPTEAPQTQAPTEAPQTQAPTEAPQTDAEKEPETETERSQRVNDGVKLTATELAGKLEKALPWLFVAEETGADDGFLDGQAVAPADEAKAILEKLAELSVDLADAQSSSDVEVINLYADEDGVLDTAQLDDKYADQVIDVTKKYFVVNVIADHADQALSFSGFDMVLSGEAVHYEEESEPGDILYNFAALDGEAFTDYTGELTLSGDPGLQGAFLAPKAKVEVASDLAGAVYASGITVAESAEDLLHIAFIEGRRPEETAPQTEAPAEATEAPETDAPEAPQSDAPAAPETEATEAPQTEAPAEATEAPQTEATEAPETDVPAATEAVTEAEPVTEEMSDAPQAETEPVTEAEAFTFTEEEVIAVDDGSGEDVPAAAVSQAVTLNVKLTDSAAAGLAGTVTVAAAETLVDGNGSVVYAKDAVAATAQATAAAPATLGISLRYSGTYYLTAQAQSGDYLGSPRRYFTISQTGGVSFGNTEGWDAATGQLTLALLTAADLESVQDGVVIRVTEDGTEGGTAVSGAAFVLGKDGKIIRDASGSPVYYLVSGGAPIVLRGLETGSYVLSQVKAAAGHRVAEDTAFTVPASQSGNVSVNIANPASDAKPAIQAAARVQYNNVVLSADDALTLPYYAALFADDALTRRVSEVRPLVFEKDGDSARTIVFTDVADGTYYIGLTDEFGERLDAQQYPTLQVINGENAPVTSILVGEGATLPISLTLQLTYAQDAYPEGFYYMATLALTKSVLAHDGTPHTTNETFYANLYTDVARTQKAIETPVVFAMNNQNTLTVRQTVKATAAQTTYYLSETDARGNIITAGSGTTAYAITYQPGDGAIAVSCRQGEFAASIQNQLSSATVKVRVITSDGQYLPGATLAIRNSRGQIMSVVNGAPTFTSGSSEIELPHTLVEGQTYYLSEINAPAGYTPIPDVSFTPAAGMDTIVTLTNEAHGTTNYSVTVTKRVYSGQYMLYARDDENGTYAKRGAYTFYAALFEDEARTRKVSNVQAITVSGQGGTTTFRNLPHGRIYYVGETDQYGTVKTSSADVTVRYEQDGRVSTTSQSQSAVIQNVYSSRPAGYRYTGMLTITKNVVDASGNAKAVNETFYAGIYRNADFSDKPTSIKIDMANNSSAYDRRMILLSGENDITYYIAEVDANGKRIVNAQSGQSSQTQGFGYEVEIDQPRVQISRGDDKNVTITNKETSSQAVLYLTKRVYSGTTQRALSATFYAGLFKDPQFTQLYTQPIPITLNNASERTMKLTLKLEGDTNVYVAEVDRNGNVIKTESQFGYEIRVINSTAQFNSSNREAHVVLINTVYGTASGSDWQQILSENGGDGTGSGNGGVATGNGEASAVQTGDETPIALYVGLLAAAVLILIILFVVRRRRKKKE